jgi:DNA-directed RNA polymerase specialized sigma24 family protein
MFTLSQRLDDERPRPVSRNVKRCDESLSRDETLHLVASLIRLAVVILNFVTVRLWRPYPIVVAEDAVQETLLRAGQYRDSVKEGALLRPCRCRVLTKVCLESMPVVWFPA